jgi:hypothetical protein
MSECDSSNVEDNDISVTPFSGVEKVAEQYEKELKNKSPSVSIGSEQDCSSWEQVPVKRRSYKDPLREVHPSSAVIYAGYHSDLSEQANSFSNAPTAWMETTVKLLVWSILVSTIPTRKSWKTKWLR